MEGVGGARGAEVGSRAPLPGLPPPSCSSGHVVIPTAGGWGPRDCTDTNGFPAELHCQFMGLQVKRGRPFELELH